MFCLKIKDTNLRKQILTSENKRKVKKFVYISLLNDQKFVLKKKYLKKCFSIKKHNFFKILGSKVRINRRCIINNRNRGVHRFCGVSRIYLRELLQFGTIPGFSKSVW
jgi:ribosomal protein S14